MPAAVPARRPARRLCRVCGPNRRGLAPRVSARSLVITTPAARTTVCCERVIWQKSVTRGLNPGTTDASAFQSRGVGRGRRAELLSAAGACVSTYVCQGGRGGPVPAAARDAQREAAAGCCCPRAITALHASHSRLRSRCDALLPRLRCRRGTRPRGTGPRALSGSELGPGRAGSAAQGVGRVPHPRHTGEAPGSCSAPGGQACTPSSFFLKRRNTNFSMINE